MTSSTHRHASPALRERFLASLDNNDRSEARLLASHLVSCANLLPSLTCIQLGLPGGSTYASAAQSVLSHDGVR
jgi:hypothetical protein